MPKKIKVDEITPLEVKFAPNCKKCQWSMVQQTKKQRKRGVLFSACSAQGYYKLSVAYNTPECNLLYTPREKGE